MKQVQVVSTKIVIGKQAQPNEKKEPRLPRESKLSNQ